MIICYDTIISGDPRDLKVNENFSGSHVTLQHISAVKISVTGLYRLDLS